MADEKNVEKAQAPEKMSKEEQIGYHKGSISVLAKEREELMRIVQITEALLQMHSKALTELGVDVSKFIGQQQQSDGDGKQPQKRVPIENLI